MEQKQIKVVLLCSVVMFGCFGVWVGCFEIFFGGCNIRWFFSFWILAVLAIFLFESMDLLKQLIPGVTQKC